MKPCHFFLTFTSNTQVLTHEKNKEFKPPLFPIESNSSKVDGKSIVKNDVLQRSRGQQYVDSWT